VDNHTLTECTNESLSGGAVPQDSGALYYGMVAPFANYSLRGWVWCVHVSMRGNPRWVCIYGIHTKKGLPRFHTSVHRLKLAVVALSVCNLALHPKTVALPNPLRMHNLHRTSAATVATTWHHCCDTRTRAPVSQPPSTRHRRTSHSGTRRHANQPHHVPSLHANQPRDVPSRHANQPRDVTQLTP
jgi:hypothetical protein